MDSPVCGSPMPVFETAATSAATAPRLAASTAPELLYTVLDP